MNEFVFKLPDLGEGTVEAEIIEWHVKPGDVVSEGDIIVDVMTDKANIEVPAPTGGKVLRTSGEPGEMVAVGAELIAFDTRSAADASDPPPSNVVVDTASTPQPETNADVVDSTSKSSVPGTESTEMPGEQPKSIQPAGPVLASPALRRRANELGIDLTQISGSGPKGRILRRDLDQALEEHPLHQNESASTNRTDSEADGGFEELKVIGVRRLIAERMQASKREIPHFSYVEEVDITELERLRVQLNNRNPEAKLTYLPLIAIALCRTLPQFPQCNQRFDTERGVLQRYRCVHLGVATQTSDGLKVPVIRDADGLDVFALNQAIREATSRAKDGRSKPSELSGSTITITSLGKLGGIVSTPVINAPEMGIIGLNNATQRPMIRDGAIVPRLMMNLSSSFDHRFVDGFDAASMIQQLRKFLETPALMFV